MFTYGLFDHDHDHDPERDGDEQACVGRLSAEAALSDGPGLQSRSWGGASRVDLFPPVHDTLAGVVSRCIEAPSSKEYVMQRRPLILLCAVAMGVSSLAVASSAAAAGGGKQLSTTLSGAEETAAADVDGSGTATLRIQASKGQVCYTLEVSDIEPAVAAHIHHAPAGVNGPVVVPLTPPTEGASSGCVEVLLSLARDILRNPEDYYVNVHNADYPAGAVRGQLG